MQKVSTVSACTVCTCSLQAGLTTRRLSTDNLSSPHDLTFDLPERIFEVAHLHVVEELCQNILKSIHNCRSYGPDKFGQTDAHTNAGMHEHQTIIVRIMSCSPQAGSTKNEVVCLFWTSFDIESFINIAFFNFFSKMVSCKTKDRCLQKEMHIKGYLAS